MSKIISKSALILGDNVKFHIGDKGGTDIAIADNGDGTSTITSTTTDFTASSESGGIVSRAFVVDDIISLHHTSNAQNEGYQGKVTAVSANSMTLEDVSGAAANESAGADINLLTFKKTFEFLESNGLSFIDGVMGIVFASWCVDLWDATDMDRYPSVFTSIEPRAKSLAAKDGWEPHNDDTLYAIRDSALEIRETADAAYTRAYALLRSTSDLYDTTDQFYFWGSMEPEMNAPRAAVMTGYVNQLVLIHDKITIYDDRGLWYIRCAEPGKTIIMESIDLQYAEIYPVSANNAIDPKLADPATGTPYHTDSEIENGADYQNILYYVDVDGIYEGDVDGTLYDFAGYIDGDNKAHQIIHEKVNWLLRQPTNINSDASGDAIRGDKHTILTSFSGNVFTVECYLENYPASERNDLRLVDINGIVRSWPSIVALTIRSPDLLVGGKFSIYHKDSFGSSSAVPLVDENDVPQEDIPAQSSVGIVIAYGSYDNDGHTPGTPIDCTLAWGRPGYVEPGTTEFSIEGVNLVVPLQPKADPSYTTA